jgi:dihydroorotase-like cyclic amidohydrolase
LAKCLPALRVRLRRNEIRQSFRRRQIEFSVFDSAPRKLARLGQPRARTTRECGKNGIEHGATAMHMEFRHVFAGEALGRRKP